MKLERNCQLRSVRDVECGSALWKNHNWRKYNCCHSVMWPRSFAGQWWRYKSTKVAQEALVAPFTDTVSSLFCWTIPPALIYSHDVGSCLDSCPSRLSSKAQRNIAQQCSSFTTIIAKVFKTFSIFRFDKLHKDMVTAMKESNR